MIETRAPGKLFIAGEYAVVEAGEPAVLIAVDRYLTVRLTPSEHLGRVHSTEYGRAPLEWSRDEAGGRIIVEHQPGDYVLSAIATVEQLRAERGLPAEYFDLHIGSELDDPSGRKFGLGSSAAVTVAVVEALDRHYGMGLSAAERFKLALLATIVVAPKASGGDLAASTFGGWIRYSAPDRAAFAEHAARLGVGATLDDAEVWAGCSVQRIDPAPSVQLLVGWTGSPASTERLVDGVRGRRERRGPAYEGFLVESRGRVADLVRALAADDAPAALEAVRGARRLLQRLGAETGIEIETPALRELCDRAEAVGAAGKPSGAGGGDCGIVLATRETDPAQLTAMWEPNGIRALHLSVHPGEVSTDGL